MGDEWSEDPSEELENFREQIRALHEESNHAEEDHSISTEGDAGGDGSSEQDQHQADETPEVTEPYTAPSEEAEAVGQEGTEEEAELHESEVKDDRDEELEQLRERVNQRYEETAVDESGNSASSENNDQTETPELESSHGDSVAESPLGEGQQTEQGDQEPNETPRDGEEEATPLETTTETPPSESSLPREEQEGEKFGLGEHDEGVEHSAPDSENDLAREPALDDAKIEEPEAPDKLDADASDLAEVEGTHLEAVPEESSSETAPSETDPTNQSLVEDAQAFGENHVEGLEGENPAKPDSDADLTETARAETPPEPDSEVSVPRENEIGDQEDGVEVRNGSDYANKTSVENPPVLQSEAEELDKTASEETPTPAKDNPKGYIHGDIEEGRQLQSGTRGAVDDTGVDLGVSQRAQGELQGEENAVSKGTFDANWGPWQPQETSREPLDRNSESTAVLVETPVSLVVGDGGAYQPESPKLSMGEVSSPVSSDDSDRRKNSRMDAEPRDTRESKPAVGTDSKSEGVLANSKSPESHAARERPGERQAVPDSGAKVSSADLGIKADSEPATRGNSTKDAPTPIDSLNMSNDRLRANVNNERLFRKEIADLDKVTEPSQGGKDTMFLEGNDSSKREPGDHLLASASQKESKPERESFPSRATRVGGDRPYAVFNFSKTVLEEQAGTKLERGKLYRISGSVEGAYDFDVYRIVDNYARIMIPAKYRDKVEYGKVYRISIRSIGEVPLTEAQRETLAKSKGLQYGALMYRLNHAGGEGTIGQTQPNEAKKIGEKVTESMRPQRLENIGASFTLRAYLHSSTDTRRYFRIPNSVFEDKTGVGIEEMRNYVIRGKIDGVGDFQKNLLRCAARQDIPIHIPKKLSEKVEVGKEYHVTVDSIEKAPEKPKPWEGTRIDAVRHWTWHEVGSWIDTEGAICCRTEKGGNYQVIVTQKEKKVLAEIALFLQSESLPSTIHLNKRTGVYSLHVSGAERAATVIKQTEPFMRTENKAGEIAEFKKSISKPRKRLWLSIRNAREILGLTETES